MATQNIEIEKGEWQDIITIGELTLVDATSYTMTVYANGESSVCIASDKPLEDFVGHPVTASTNFNFTYSTGDKIWVKLNAIAGDVATVILT